MDRELPSEMVDATMGSLLVKAMYTELKSRPKRVLTVEWDSVIAYTLDLLFAGHGCECRVVRSGEDAISLTKHWVPDIVIQDLGSVGTPGLDALDSLHRRHGCQIVTLSAQVAPPSIIKSKERGYPVLSKPVPPKLLLEAVGVLPVKR